MTTSSYAVRRSENHHRDDKSIRNASVPKSVAIGNTCSQCLVNDNSFSPARLSLSPPGGGVKRKRRRRKTRFTAFEGSLALLLLRGRREEVGSARNAAAVCSRPVPEESKIQCKKYIYIGASWEKRKIDLWPIKWSL